MFRRMQYLRRVIVLGLSCLISGTILANNTRDTLRVLFVGNSYTYYNNLIQMVSLISDSLDTKLICTKSTVGGTNLGEHWREEKGLHSKSLVKNGHYDVVVLQDHSLRAIEALDSLLYFGNLFCALVKQKRAKTLLYNTWAREKDPAAQTVINKGYQQLATTCGASLVPVGDCWQTLLGRSPSSTLYQADGSHPSNLGTFLIALSFVKSITGKLPATLPTVYNYYDRDGETFRIMQVSKEEISMCMEIVNGLVKPSL
jgi:hypothetical protein